MDEKRNDIGQKVTPEEAFEVLQNGGAIKHGGYTFLGEPSNPKADNYCSFGTFPRCASGCSKHTLEFLQRFEYWRVMTLYDLVCDRGFKLDPWTAIPLDFINWHVTNQLGYQLTEVYRILHNEPMGSSILEDPNLNVAFWRTHLKR